MTPAGPDPLGKRALFWVGGSAPEPGRLPPGKEALYSTAPAPGAGPFVVECSGCRAVSRIGLVDLLLFQLPFGYWLPRGRFDRRMTCPACRRRSWVSLTCGRSAR